MDSSWGGFMFSSRCPAWLGVFVAVCALSAPSAILAPPAWAKTVAATEVDVLVDFHWGVKEECNRDLDSLQDVAGFYTGSSGGQLMVITDNEEYCNGVFPNLVNMNGGSGGGGTGGASLESVNIKSEKINDASFQVGGEK